MAIIRPSADLRNKYNEISRLCHETNEPIYITKNGHNDLVILSNEAYDEREEEKVNRLIEKHFNKKYADFESFKKDIYEKLDKALKSQGRPLAEFCAEMEEKYHINE